ncbi:anthranilate synthase component II [Aliikangiella sp. IMCC44653]
MLDNYDSFTFNLVHYFEMLEAEVVVRRNDEVTLEVIESLEPTHIVISPGPCDPDRAGISIDTIKYFQQHTPILGVCLGHQAIGQAFGGKVIRAKQVMHGKTSPVLHTGKGVFKGIESPFSATRYHSLVLDKMSLPNCLEVTAWTENALGEFQHIMGVSHKELNLQGIQFHPESILSESGLKLLSNFIEN